MQRRSCHFLAARPIASLGPPEKNWPYETIVNDLRPVWSARRSNSLARGGDRGFESSFLRRRVCLASAFHAYRRKDPAFARSVSLDVTRERDVLATSRLASAAFL